MSGEITLQKKNTVLRLLTLGHSPREIASKSEITKKQVIEIYMQGKQKKWPELIKKLNQSQQVQLRCWINDISDVIREKTPLAEAELIKERIREIQGKINNLPLEKKGRLLTLKTMSRMGIRDACLVDLSMDAEYVGYRQLINLLQKMLEKRYRERIRQSMSQMDTQTRMVAEKYLAEEIYKPF